MNRAGLITILFLSGYLLNGCGSGIATPPPVATLSVTAASSTATAGTPFNVTVSALNASGAVATSYSGTVHFTSSDAQAELPANSTLTNGTGTFPVTLKTGGGQTIKATDTVKASITGTSNSINVLAIIGPPPNGIVGQAYGGPNSATEGGCTVGFFGWLMDTNAGSPDGDFWHWSAAPGSSLPPGLTVSVASKTCGIGAPFTVRRSFIGGTPTTAGTYTVILAVAYGPGPVGISANYTITISAPGAAAAATKEESASQQHHHYKLIDIGTFGGPSSYFDNLHLTDNYGFNAVFYNFSQVLSRKGVFVGFADTTAPDPYSANPVFCYVPDCFVTHAYQWQNGVATDLGALTDAVSSAAFWVNSNGLIAGDSENGELDPVIPGLPELRAVVWKNGKIRELGTLGGSSSFSQAVNDRGQVTGLALNGTPDLFSFYYQYLYCLPFEICPANATETRAFIWDEKDGMQDLGTLGGPDAFPSLINQHGQIAGFSYTDATPNPTTGFPTLHPFLWESGKGMKDLGSLGGTTTASVNGLSERGQVVGGALLAGDLINHPFLWDGERLVDLVAPPFGGNADGESSWINEAGEVVGIAGIPAPCPGSAPAREAAHAFLWRQGAMTDLGALPGSPISQANFINSRSQIVGDSMPCDFSAVTAFLWENGSMVDLNTLVLASTPFYLFTASFIDDGGEIAAFGILGNGDQHALLLIPCDDAHPNIEGCDYSLTDASAVANGKKPAATDWTFPRETIKQLMRSLGPHKSPWHRGFGAFLQN